MLDGDKLYHKMYTKTSLLRRDHEKKRNFQIQPLPLTVHTFSHRLLSFTISFSYIAPLFHRWSNFNWIPFDLKSMWNESLSIFGNVRLTFYYVKKPKIWSFPFPKIDKQKVPFHIDIDINWNSIRFLIIVCVVDNASGREKNHRKKLNKTDFIKLPLSINMHLYWLSYSFQIA